jgi:hypothetical protein
MAGLNSKINDIERKITAFYNETRNIAVLNNVWKLSRFNPNVAGGNNSRYANFFKVINTIDSIKDGTQKDLAANVFMGSLLQDNGSTNLPSPDSFKQAIKTFFSAKIKTNHIRKIPYSRIKGDRNEKQVICDRSFYDCNLKPNKIARKVGTNTAPDEKITIGNKIDTGPSNTENMTINCKTRNAYLNKTHMTILGYTDTELSFNNLNGKCENLVLFGKTYSQPEKALKQLAVGNNKKVVILNSKIRLTLKDKAGYIYYKSLGDKLIAYCYYLDCEPPPQQQSSKCLFTCDVFVALLAYIFDESFVYNENDTMPKVTNVFYRNIAGNGEIDYNDLCETEKTKILDEYNSEIGRIQTIIDQEIDPKRKFMFTGDTRTYRNTTGLVGNFLQIMIEKLQLLQGNLDVAPVTSLEDYTNIKRYKLMKLLKPNTTTNEFIRTRYQVCINDTTGFKINNDPKKYTIYDLYQNLFKREQPQNGGVKLTDTGVNQIYDALYEVEPKIGFNDMTLENNLLKYVIEIYKTQKNTYTIIPSCFGCMGRIDDFFNNNYIWVNNDDEFGENEKGQPYVLEMTMTGYKRGYFDYGHIYDVLTYYFYADANYEDNYIINIIQGIFNGIIEDDVLLPKTYTYDPEILTATEIQVERLRDEEIFDVDTSQCAPSNYECINTIRNKWLKIRGNQKVPKEATSKGATLEVTSSDDDEDAELSYISDNAVSNDDEDQNTLRVSTKSPTAYNDFLGPSNISNDLRRSPTSFVPISSTTLRFRPASASPTKFYGGVIKTKKRKIKRRKTLKKNKKQRRRRKTIKK